MDKLFVFFIIALVANGAFGQSPGLNQSPGQNQFPGQNQNQFPGQNSNTAPTTSATPTGTTTQSPAVRACITSCPVTSEFNPVCGTDNVTYNNPGRLICAQLCGVNVSLSRSLPCPTPAPAVPAQ